MYTEEQVIELMASAIMNNNTEDIYPIERLKQEFPNIFKDELAKAKQIFEFIK